MFALEINIFIKYVHFAYLWTMLYNHMFFSSCSPSLTKTLGFCITSKLMDCGLLFNAFGYFFEYNFQKFLAGRSQDYRKISFNFNDLQSMVFCHAWSNVTPQILCLFVSLSLTTTRFHLVRTSNERSCHALVFSSPTLSGTMARRRESSKWWHGPTRHK